MQHIALSQGQIALVDDEDFARVSRSHWCYRGERGGAQGYAIRRSFQMNAIREHASKTNDQVYPHEKPSATEFWKEVDDKQAAFDAWGTEVAKLPAEKQVEAVATELKKRNPGFDGKVQPTIEAGQVVKIAFLTDEVTDTAPVRALPRLKVLGCNGGGNHKGKLADLWPLKNLKLTQLHCEDTKVSDLSPLKDMKLVGLTCYRTPVSDLSPLTGMRLEEILFERTQVRDLGALAGMPLKKMSCDFKPERDADILRSIKTLESINSKPAAEFWKEVGTPTTSKP